MRLLLLVLGLGLACAVLAAPARAQASAPVVGGPFSPVLEIDVDAAPRRVWAALTRDIELSRWFCRTAVMDCRLGGSFRWSHEEIDLREEEAQERRLRALVRARRLTEAEAARLRPPDRWLRARIVTVVPNRVLEYDWTWEGTPTRVSWELLPVPGAPNTAPRTRVRVSHLILRNQRNRTQVFQAALFHLREYLADGQVQFRYADDVHVSKEGVSELKLRIAAPPARVWRLLTQPDEMAKHQEGGQAACDGKAGGRIVYGWGDGGTIREWKPPRLLVHTWPGTDARITWELDRRGRGETEVRFSIEGLKDVPDAPAVVLRWGAALRRLRFVAETNGTLDLAVR